MMRKLFYDDENIIGYSSDIIEDIKEEQIRNKRDEYTEEEEATNEIFNELIEKLEQYDNELVICYYHPMGTYYVKRLKEED